MPDVTGGILGVVSSLVQADAASSAAEAQSQAAQSGIDAQSEASRLAIEEQRRQFDLFRELLSPYTQAGQPALKAQQDLLGLNGPDAQRAAMSGIEGSEMFKSLAQQGENAILQNASATGGLRGGNTQAALAQFRPSMLNQLISQQYDRLGGLTTMGQNSAAGVGTAGMGSANSIGTILGNQGNTISALLAQQGAAEAGGDLGRGKGITDLLANLSRMYGVQAGQQVPSYPPVQDAKSLIKL